MDKENNGTETKVEIIPTPTVVEKTEAEIKIEALEKEKLEILEREANYKMAYLKEKDKNREADPNEPEEDKIRRIAREVANENRISEIDKEKEGLLKKTIKENSELKLALKNKTDIPASTSTHTEGQAVKDNIISSEQLAQFKAMGKDDKWIANYKKNLLKNR